MGKTRRLLTALAAIGTLAIVVAFVGGGIRSASAAVSTISNGGNFTSGGTTTITVNANDQNTMIGVTASGATNPVLTVTSCTGTNLTSCSSTLPGSSVTITPAGTGSTVTVGLSLTATCTTSTNITVTASQGNLLPVPSTTVTCNPVAVTATTVTVVGPGVVIPCGATAQINVQVLSNGTPLTGATVLLDASAGSITPSGITGVNGIFTALFQPPFNTTGGTVLISAQSGGVVGQTTVAVGSCVAAVGPVAVVTIAVPTATVSCGGSTLITVSVTDSLGHAVVNGTPVVLTTSMGTISSSLATSGGTVVAFLQAPSSGSGGTAVITATAGGVVSQQASVVFAACAAPVVQPQPVVVQPQPVVVQPQPAVVRAPNAGDAGLLSSESTSLPVILGVAMMVIASAGAYALLRKRTSE